MPVRCWGLVLGEQKGPRCPPTFHLTHSVDPSPFGPRTPSYVQGNQLGSLAGLGGAPALQTLNASGNRLRSLAGVEACGATLHTLLAAGNCLEDGAAALDPLLACPALESLDLSANALADPAPLLALLRRLPALRCLYLRGNPLVSALPQYRKSVIAAAPGLTYLDDRPVFERERRCAEAWARGGADAERAEREACAAEEAAAERGRLEALQAVRRQGIAKVRGVGVVWRGCYATAVLAAQAPLALC